MIQHTDLSQPIYESLKEMIYRGELKPGEKIIQEKIAENLGVSRTPLMKALLMLENEFLIESIPRRGMFIKKRNINQLVEVYQCREALEGMAARILATQKNRMIVDQLHSCFEPFKGKSKINKKKYALADEKFHKLLIKLTGNQPLDKIYFFGKIHDEVIGYGLVRPPEETLNEHFKIIEAIANGKEDNAEKYAREHIQKSRELISKNI